MASPTPVAGHADVGEEPSIPHRTGCWSHHPAQGIIFQYIHQQTPAFWFNSNTRFYQWTSSKKQETNSDFRLTRIV